MRVASNLRRILLIMMFLCLFSDYLSAQTSVRLKSLVAEPGARDAGMGGAVVACAKGVEALYYNPAALVNLKTACLSACMNNGIYFADYYSLSWAKRLNTKRSIGVIYSRSYNGGGVHYDPVQKKSIDSRYYDLNISLSFAQEINPIYAIGINAKYIRSVWGSPSVICDTENGFAIDVGGLMRRPFGKGTLNTGFVFRNIGPPLVTSERKLPSSLNFGFGIEQEISRSINLTLECDLTDNFQGYVQGFDFRCGTQLSIKELLYLRGGFISKRELYKYFVFGGGISWEGVSLDLAFAPVQPKREPRIMTFWRISLSYGQ
jgi:hypothetical protein